MAKRRNILGRPLTLGFCALARCGFSLVGCDFNKEGEIASCDKCQRRQQCKIKRLYPTRGSLLSMLYFSGQGNLRHNYQQRDNLCKLCGATASSPRLKKRNKYCPAGRNL